MAHKNRSGFSSFPRDGEITVIRTESVSLASPTSGLKKRLKPLLGADWPEAYLFMLPTVLLLAGVVAYPFLLALYLSFTNTHIASEIGEFVGIQNYVRLWQDKFFRASIWITIQYTFWTVLFKFIIGLGAALILHRLKRLAIALAGLVLLPWVLPEVVRAVTWRGLLDPLYGLVNRLLIDLNFIERPIAFLGEIETALPSVILVSIWSGVPFFTIVLLAGLKAIDQELYEAAAIDGAGVWRQFLHITLPGLRHVIIVGILLSTIWALNDFTPIFVLTRGGPLGTTIVYTIRVYEAALNLRFGVGAAMGITLVPILSIFILLLSRYMLAGHQTGKSIAFNSEEPRPGFLYYLFWPIRQSLHLLLAIFWLVNDLFERLMEGIGAALGRLIHRVQIIGHAQKEPRHSFHNKLVERAITGLAGGLLFILLVFLLAPFYWVVITSFKTTFQITTLTNVLWPQPWSLEQYDLLLGSTRNFSTWFLNSLFISLLTPLISTFVGALGAYALVRLRWHGRNTFSTFVLVAYMTPGVLLLIPLELVFKQLDLMGSLWSLVIAYPSFTLPFALWMMMGYYASIPEELESAALIDGCNRIHVFLRIVLPLTAPALTAVFLFGVTHAWGEYLFASRFFRETLPVVLAQMTSSGVAPWGELTAASVLMSAPVFAIYALGQRFMVEGLAAGAVKGSG